MKQYSGKLVGFLSAVILLLLVTLTLQTSYLVWLHMQLYRAVAGTSAGLGDLERILTTDVGRLSSHVRKPGEAPLPTSPEPGVDSLLDRELGALGNLKGLKGGLGGMLGDSLNDPNVRGLLKDLDMEDLFGLPDSERAPQTEPLHPAPAPEEPAPSSFRPVFGFEETDDAYVVTMDLPGVRESDVYAVVDGGKLDVSGKRDGVAFKESFAFPGPVDPGSERVSFKAGRLTVTVRKAAPPPLAD
jgi:HSP20 family molecular chaperone IbpA